MTSVVDILKNVSTLCMDRKRENPLICSRETSGLSQDSMGNEIAWDVSEHVYYTAPLLKNTRCTALRMYILCLHFY